MGTMNELEVSAMVRLDAAAKAYLKSVKAEKAWLHSSNCAICAGLQESVRTTEDFLGFMKNDRARLRFYEKGDSR